MTSVFNRLPPGKLYLKLPAFLQSESLSLQANGTVMLSNSNVNPRWSAFRLSAWTPKFC